MARKRNINTKHNIKYVHIANGRLVYRPYIKKSKRHEGITVDSNGFLKPPIKLGKPDDDPDLIMKSYLLAKEQLLKEEMSAKGTLGFIVNEYINSSKYKQKAISSQTRDKNLIRILNHPLKIDGNKSCLSEINLEDLSKPLINSIAEKRLENYKLDGKKGEVQVNREITFLSSALSWAENYVPNLPIDRNPLKGIKKLKNPRIKGTLLMMNMKNNTILQVVSQIIYNLFLN